MKLALIGHPISHSKSPLLFKELRPEWQYDLIETADFQEAITTFKASYDAINVTAPFKEEAFKIADTHEDLCAQIGATNLLVKENGVIKAYNTDVHGIIKCLLEGIKRRTEEQLEDYIIDNTIEFRNENSEKSIEKRFKTCPQTLSTALIIGGGGAGKAAIAATLKVNFQTTIINRDYQKIIEIQKRFPEINICKISELAKAVKENDIIIYTLPVSIPGLDQIDFSNKIIIEANYLSPSLSTHKSRIYIGGDFWLRQQAEAGAKIISISSLFSPLVKAEEGMHSDQK